MKALLLATVVLLAGCPKGHNGEHPPRGVRPPVARAASVALAAGAGKLRTEPKLGLEFVFIPDGTSWEGCEPQDEQCMGDEFPGAMVSVKGFWIEKTEVPVSAYEKCVAAGACTPPNFGGPSCNFTRRPTHPVNCMDWYQADAFCKWIGGRLPTASEWEYAAKSGESRVFPWGNEPVSGKYLDYCDKKCPEAFSPQDKARLASLNWIDTTQDDGWAGTAPCGSYPAGATAWGVLDMAGNICEWTSTPYRDGMEVRGGTFGDPPLFQRASDRNSDPKDMRGDGMGVRCALSP